MTEPSLFEQLKYPDPGLRDQAMREITETRDETTIPRLMRILAEENTVYRRAAVKTLGAIGIDTIPLLVDSLLKSDNSTIRSSCAKALAQIAYNYKDLPFPSEGIKGLKEGLNDSHPVVQITSAMALGVIGVPALDTLLEVLDQTDNVGLAVAIINAVSSIDDDRSIEILTKLGNDESADTYVREVANGALSRLDMLKFKSHPG